VEQISKTCGNSRFWEVGVNDLLRFSAVAAGGKRSAVWVFPVPLIAGSFKKETDEEGLSSWRCCRRPMSPQAVVFTVSDMSYS